MLSSRLETKVRRKPGIVMPSFLLVITLVTALGDRFFAEPYTCEQRDDRMSGGFFAAYGRIFL